MVKFTSRELFGNIMSNKKDSANILAYQDKQGHGKVVTLASTQMNRYGISMKQEDKLKEEVEFWLTYINDWKTNHDEPMPERALTLLKNAQLKLKDHYSEKNQAMHLQ
jgi:hypothetical protein